MIPGRYNPEISRLATPGLAEVMYLTRVSDRQDVQVMAGELFHTDGSRKYLTQEERVRYRRFAMSSLTPDAAPQKHVR